MNLPHVNTNNFLVPGTNMVNTGAARNEQYRLQGILTESSRANQPKKQTAAEWHRDFVETKERPLQEKLLSLGTAHSVAHVSFGGRGYTLPPVTISQTTAGIRIEDQFGGLGVTAGFRKMYDASFGNIIDQHHAIRLENEAATKKSKKLFSRSSKPFQKIAPPDISQFYSQINRMLAESRIALSVNEDFQNDEQHGEVFRHPSSVSGDLLGEMKAWSDSHWKGVPEVKHRDWERAIIAAMPRQYLPI